MHCFLPWWPLWWLRWCRSWGTWACFRRWGNRRVSHTWRADVQPDQGSFAHPHREVSALQITNHRVHYELCLDLHTYAVCDRFTQYKSPDQPAFILLLVLQHAQVLFRHGRCCFLIGWGGNKTWRMRTDWLNVKSGEWKEFYLSRLSEGLWFGLGVVLSVCPSCPAAPRSPETRRKRS